LRQEMPPRALPLQPIEEDTIGVSEKGCSSKINASGGSATSCCRGSSHKSRSVVIGSSQTLLGMVSGAASLAVDSDYYQI
jgi:hypothetical protein